MRKHKKASVRRGVGPVHVDGGKLIQLGVELGRRGSQLS